MGARAAIGDGNPGRAERNEGGLALEGDIGGGRDSLAGGGARSEHGAARDHEHDNAGH